MTSESGGQEGRQWLVQPPGAQEINFQISAGENVEVTPEVLAAFEQLVQSLRGDDVQGFIYDPKCTKRSIDCTSNGTCSVEYQRPACLIDYGCRIGRIG